jgi:hypothetical protein
MDGHPSILSDPQTLDSSLRVFSTDYGVVLTLLIVMTTF